jgi:hypothetical protein
MKIFFFDLKSKTLVPYVLDIHSELSFKFLGWKEDGNWIILVGPCKPETSVHKKLHALAIETGDISIPRRNPDAAGNIMFEEIVEWRSSGYNIKTPVEDREIIASALGMKSDN